MAKLMDIIEEEEDHEHEGAIFIPFIWPRMAPRTFYKESDPDWQEFAKVAGDEERLNTIRGTRPHLEETCRSQVLTSPSRSCHSLPFKHIQSSKSTTTSRRERRARQRLARHQIPRSAAT